MKNQINVAELLKECPQGMELDCTMFDDVVFERVDSELLTWQIILRRLKSNTTFITNKYGQYYNAEEGKCIIFPKGKTTWEGFVPPIEFKDGDIVITTLDHIAIIKEPLGKEYSTHVLKIGNTLIPDARVCASRFATEEKKEKLFQAIKNAGYKWNEKTKTLEELIEPKFKVGDRVRNKYYKDYIYDIHDITDKGYRAREIDADSPIIILFGSPEDNYELVPNKFDITTLKPFDKVLVRDSDKGSWSPSFWGYHVKCSCLMYNTVSGYYNQCIPYEGNEHLLGTKGDCNEYYKTWEKKA